MAQKDIVKRIFKGYWYLFISLLIMPIIFNIFSNVKIPYTSWILPKATYDGWYSFMGSYVSSVCTVIIFIITIVKAKNDKEDQRIQYENEKKEQEKRHEKELKEQMDFFDESNKNENRRTSLILVSKLAPYYKISTDSMSWYETYDKELFFRIKESGNNIGKVNKIKVQLGEFEDGQVLADYEINEIVYEEYIKFSIKDYDINKLKDNIFSITINTEDMYKNSYVQKIQVKGVTVSAFEYKIKYIDYKLDKLSDILSS